MKLTAKPRHSPRSQKGLASVVIVLTLITLIAAISLGFARLMNRSLQNSVNSQLSAAAEFAAQSGISDAAAYVQANPTAKVTDCDELLSDSGGLKFAGIAAADLSGDQIVRYTCMLIDPLPKDIVVQDIPPWESEVVRLSTTSPADSFMFSWQSTDRSKNVFVADPSRPFFNEQVWSANRYAPVLRVSLYQVNINTSAVGADYKTFFLYPNEGTGQFGTLSYGQPSGVKADGNCDTDPAPQSPPSSTPFDGDAIYDCNTVITGLQTPPPDWMYYARITPFYNNTDIRVQANAANTSINFNNVQTVVDVTAKANSAVKRLQARVAVNDPNNIEAGTHNMPENSLRSASTICKRLVLPDGLPSLEIDGNAPSCNFIDPTLPPTVNLSANPTSVGVGGASTLTWVTTENPDSCTASGDWSGNKDPNGNTESTGGLGTARTYTFTITCDKAGFPPATDSVDVTVTSGGGGGGSCPNPPTGGPIIGSDPCVVDFLFVGWSGSGSATFSLWASHCYTSLSINGVNVSWIPVPSDNSTYYNYTIALSNAGGSVQAVCQGNGGTSTATISVPPFGGPPPPPPPPCPSPPGSGPCGGPPPPPPPYIVYWDCHPVSNFYWIWEHWSDGAHINTGTGLPNVCAV